MERLKDQVALVTGAGRGIGFAVATAFAREGAKLAINDINPAAAAEAAQKLQGRAYPADVTDKSAVQQMVADVVADYGKIDILMANAGIIRIDSVIETSEADWDSQMAINAKGVFLCFQAAGAQMVAQGHGKIIATASSASKIAEPFLGAYSASKFAVWGLVQAMALEMAPHQINVNCICPVNVETDMTDLIAERYASLKGGTETSQKASFHTEIPWGRMARPEEVADVAVFLACSESNYLTGQGINVSGGLVFN
jgi:NAD(P)-dependent dehydrogenase (short-subunit alcohol dehydrogenase family)